SGQKLSSALAAAKVEFASQTASILLNFVASAKRGVCADAGQKSNDETAGD
ncbi:MAG: acyl-[acyl-carrier-protein]--UDP-N-acetylglucosamine O-acyltransferase, partial [Verrucomicrobia bacterium]